MQFKDIIGQADVKKRLINSVREGFVPHAQLFCGPEGVGKLALAIAYAQYLNCHNPSEEDSCGVCPSCVKFNNLAHPDLHFVFPIVKKGKKEVCDDYIKDWRDMVLRSPYFNYMQWLNHIEAGNSQGVIYTRESDEIIRKLSLKIYEAKYKVMIVWMPEKMHDACANALLKIIEEPTENTVFLLVSAVPDRVIGTIQSRCQRFPVKAIEEADVATALVSEYNIDTEQAKEVAHLSKGSYLDAVENITVSEENQMFFDLFVQMMRASYARNIKLIKTIGERLAEIGRERQKNFLIYAQRMVREYFVTNLQQPDMVYLSKSEANFGVRFAPFVNEKNIIDLMDELALAERHIEQNVNAKMVFYDLCLKITMLIKQ